VLCVGKMVVQIKSSCCFYGFLTNENLDTAAPNFPKWIKHGNKIKTETNIVIEYLLRISMKFSCEVLYDKHPNIVNNISWMKS
jgi:hypothetical protein